MITGANSDRKPLGYINGEPFYGSQVVHLGFD